MIILSYEAMFATRCQIRSTWTRFGAMASDLLPRWRQLAVAQIKVAELGRVREGGHE
jgi:hypothetical protein